MVLRNPKAKALVCFLVLVVSACASTPDESTELVKGAEKVRIFMTEQRNCKFIGEVSARYDAEAPYEETEEKARTRIKNLAFEKKANAIVIQGIERQPSQVSNAGETLGFTRIFGSAYDCRF